MRMWLLPIMLIVVVVLAAPGATGASGVPHQKVRFQGTWAEASWLTNSPTETVWTYINVSIGDGQGISVVKEIDHYDANRNYTGRTSINASASSGYTASIKKLRSATLSASNLPAQQCEYGPHNEVGPCVATTISSISADIMAQGPTMREISNDRFMFDGFSTNSHSNGTRRYGTATGTINGVPLTSADLSNADLGVGKGGMMVVCRGSETCD